MIKKITFFLCLLGLSWSFAQTAAPNIILEEADDFNPTSNKRNYLWNGIPILIEVNEKNTILELENSLKSMIEKIGVVNFADADNVVFTFKSNPSLVIFYSSFQVDGNEIKNKLVQGVIFYINDEGNLVFNFSILEKKLLVKINGIYQSMTEVKKKIADALKNPASFIRRNDPEYILNQIILNQDNLKKTNEELKKINLSLNNFIKAWYAYENKSFFGAPTPIEDSVIEKIIDLKKNDESLDAAAIEKILRSEKINNVNKNIIELVLSLNYSEFRK